MKKNLSKSFCLFQNEKYILEYEQNMIKNSVVFFLFA